MIKVTLKYGGQEKKILVPEQRKVREVLEECEVSYSAGVVVTVGDRFLNKNDLDRELHELTDHDSSDLTIRIDEGDDLPWETREVVSDDDLPQTDPSKALVVGCACIIFSEFTPDELWDFQRYMPEVMSQRDEHGDPVFAISVDEKSPGSLNEYGAVFSTKTNRQGHATITIVIDPECEDTEKLVRDSLGSSILRLMRMEQYLLKKQSELDEKKSLLADHIARI